MSAASSALSINIDVVNDLKDLSHLKTLFDSDQSTIFKIGPELAQFVGQPVSTAGSSQPVKIGLSAPGSWKTASGISFSLSASASCTITIGDRSTKFAVAKSIDSSATSDVLMGPADGSVWINLELDFDIKGNVAGAGNVGGVGISGKASGSASASMVYCHQVDGTTETLEAVKDAFSRFAFPFHPDCALAMAKGDISKVNFDASLSFGVDATYGLGSYKFSAPGVDAATKSFKVGAATLKPPSVDLEAGAKGSVSYTHQSHFGAIVAKANDQNATLYLFRSSSDEVDLSAGVTVGVSVTDADVSLDSTALGQAVDHVTGTGGTLVASVANDVKGSLLTRTNNFIGNLKGDAGLSASLARQSKRALLYEFAVDLTNADLTEKSWGVLSAGNVFGAKQIGGMKLVPGSGVTDQLKRTVTIGLHFFNLFSAKDTETYFRTSTTEVGPDGSIRFLFDIGNESGQDSQKAMRKTRIHFVASAKQEGADSVGDAEVDLYIEFSESGRAKEANQISATIGAVPAQKVNDVQAAIAQFAKAGPAGKLNVVTILKPSAYQRITCSPYTGAKHDIPPASPQTEDCANWNAFHDAAESILGYRFLQGVTYAKWVQYNKICTGANVADRRSAGNTSTPALNSSFWGNLQNVSGPAGYFLRCSAGFMNLCDDLNALAGLVGQVNTTAAWNRLLDELTFMVTKDAAADWSKPAASAISGRFGGGGVQTDVVPGKSDLTCTITLS
jgi:hypothetical protein